MSNINYPFAVLYHAQSSVVIFEREGQEGRYLHIDKSGKTDSCETKDISHKTNREAIGNLKKHFVVREDRVNKDSRLRFRYYKILQNNTTNCHT